MLVIVKILFFAGWEQKYRFFFVKNKNITINFSQYQKREMIQTNIAKINIKDSLIDQNNNK